LHYLMVDFTRKIQEELRKNEGNKNEEKS
jgi:hypothetical protein